MAHFFATFTMVGSNDTTHFGSLEFPTLPPVGMWVPPVFEPSQAFLLGSLDFVADRLGVLHLCKEALVPAPIGGVPSISSGMHDDFNNKASALHFEQTLCSNPTVSIARSVIYSLFTVLHQSSGGTVLSMPRPPHLLFPYGLMSSADVYARGSEKC